METDKEPLIINKRILLVLLLFLLTSRAYSRDQPAWSVNPADYQNSANLTALLNIDHAISADSNDLLGAFSGEECRGVVHPVQVGETQLFFLTMYSNLNSESLTLKTYIAGLDTTITINESIEFIPGAEYGNPTYPFELNAIVFYDHIPTLSSIPDQVIEIGGVFTQFDLDDYLIELDGDEVSMSFTGSQHLIIDIAADNLVSVSLMDAQWVGSDTIFFMATDQTDSALVTTDTVHFSVLALDHPPELTVIPGETIGAGGSFTSIDLEDYLLEVDGDSVQWSLQFLAPTETDPVPAWNVDPADFNSSMSLTVQMSSRGAPVQSADYTLAAFVGDECRGIASPVLAIDEWIFFLTVYSNTSGETLHFRLYDSPNQIELPILEDQVFESGVAIGSPESPVQLQAGFLLTTIGANRYLNLMAVDSEWYGSESLEIIAQDHATLNSYRDSISVTFSILQDHTPLVHDIENQTIELGENFVNFDLDDYLTELDGDDVIWSVTGNTELNVSLDAGNLTSITAINASWTGSESLIFTATDDNANLFNGSDTAIFSITPLDHPPSLNTIPDQIIGNGGSFQNIALNDYIIEIDGHSTEWTYTFDTPVETHSAPSWTVNPADYESDMTLTASIVNRGQASSHANLSLAVFSGEECRGITSPIQALDTWLYFLTIYANETGEQLSFKLYDNDIELELPIRETFDFDPAASVGSPEIPMEMQAGFLLISIDPTDHVSIESVDPLWSGTERVWFSSTDQGTENQYSDSTLVSFTILEDHTPLVSDIPDQTIEQGSLFSAFDLDDYLTELDDDEVSWSVEGELNLNVTINPENMVDLQVIDTEWIGSETLIFTVTDMTANSLYASDEVIFNVFPLDHPPEISSLPDDTIGVGGEFQILDLSDYLNEIDGDSVVWTYDYALSMDPVNTPDWSFNPVDYEHNMSLTSRVNLRGQTSEVFQNILGVFSGDECRGIAQPVIVGEQALYFLTIHGQGLDEDLELRIYDSQRLDTLEVHERFTFESNAIVGTPDQPVELTAQNIELELISDNTIQITHVNPNWSGTEGIQINVQDINTIYQYSDSTLVHFTVLDELAPSVLSIPDYEISEGELFPIIALDEYLIYPEPQDVNWNVSGAESLLVSILDDHQLSIEVPHENWFGAETLTIDLSLIENPALNTSQLIDFTVLPVNDRPQVASQNLVLEEDSSMGLDLFASDIEFDELTLSFSQIPVNGILEEGVYSPDPNFNGSDSLKYLAFDGELYSDTGVVYFDVISINDLPEFNSNPQLQVEQGIDYEYQLIASDIDGDSLIYNALALPAWLQFDGINLLTGTPADQHVGSHDIVVTVHDTVQPSINISQAFTIEVGNVNDTPVFISSVRDSISQNQAFEYVCQAEDPDGDSLTYSVYNLPDWLTFDDVASVRGVPSNDQVGSVQFSCTVIDPWGASDTIVVDLVVANVNDIPIANAGQDQDYLSGSGIQLDGAQLSYDIDGDSLTYEWNIPNGVVANSTIEPVLISLLPHVIIDTSLVFLLRVSDGSLVSNWDSLYVYVHPLSDVESSDFTQNPQSSGESIQLEISFPEYFLPIEAWLYYEVGGSTLTDSVEMENVTRAQTWSAFIPSNAVTQTGVSYYAIASDDMGTTVTTSAWNIPVSFMANLISMNSSRGSGYPAGIPNQTWRLVSIPTYQNDSSVENLFQNSLGESEGDHTWRLYDWDGIGWQIPDTIVPGMGYWFQQRLEETSSLVLGEGYSVDLTGFSVQLNAGWNLFSSPYNFPIYTSFDSVRFSGPFVYSDTNGEGWTSLVDSLRPWTAYALYNWTDSLTAITLKPGTRSESLPKINWNDGWELILGGSNGILSDNDNSIGRSSEASNTRDRFDRIEPPTWGEYLQLSVHNPNMVSSVSHYSSDIRILNDDVEVWNVELAVSQSTRAVELKYHLVGDLAPHHSIVLLDLETREWFAVESGIVLNPIELQPEYLRKYHVISGPTQEVYRKIDEILSSLPQHNKLIGNYPNPFNGQTNISFSLHSAGEVQLDIFDIRGRFVKTLVNQVFDLGYYNIAWNGLDEHLVPVSSGIYFYRISVNSGSGKGVYRSTQKMVLVR
ncbi:MAG: T9SS type A sorting domain-containing protein [Candidatus Marinimicrobia bacterium]|nr:T9SS type A sorting domain-containing protein [Candidatus Neomarinimicrobiota bacterium]